MSLNDNVLDDITGDSALSLDGVTPPNTKDDKVAATIVVDATSQNVDGSTSLNNGEIAAIPDMAAKLQLLTDRGTKIVEMQDIRDDIEDGDSMSRSKAGTIESTFENFFSQTNPQGGYTSLESRTNLLYAKNFMAARIQASHEALAADLAVFAADSLPLVTQAASGIKDGNLYEASRGIYEANQVVQELSCDLSRAKNLVVPDNQGRFVNFAKDDLTMIDIDSISSPKLINYPLNSEKFRAAFRDLTALWRDSNAVRSVFHPQYKDLSALDTGNGPRACPLTLSMMLKSFSDCDGTLYDQVVAMSNTALDRLEVHRAKIELTLAQDVSQAAPFLAKDGAEIMASLDLTACIQQSVQEIANFATACSVVIAGLSALNAM